MFIQKYANVYNSIFDSGMQYVEYLIKTKNFNYECVDYIAKLLCFVKMRNEKHLKRMKCFQYFAEFQEFKKLDEKLKTEENSPESQLIYNRILEIKALFDVSQDESVILSNKSTKQFIILSKELMEINKIKNALVPVNNEKCSWHDVLLPLKNNNPQTKLQATLWVKQIINTYFLKSGLPLKPEFQIAEENNATLCESANNKIGFTINESLLNSINAPEDKVKLATSVIELCALAKTQIILTEPKQITPKTAQVALLGAKLIDSCFIKNESVNSTDYVNSEVQKIIYGKTTSEQNVKVPVSELLLLQNYAYNMINPVNNLTQKK